MNPSQLRAAWLNSGQWSVLSGSVDTNKHVVNFKTGHFSTYAIIVPAGSSSNLLNLGGAGVSWSNLLNLGGGSGTGVGWSIAGVVVFGELFVGGVAVFALTRRKKPALATATGGATAVRSNRRNAAVKEAVRSRAASMDSRQTVTADARSTDMSEMDRMMGTFVVEDPPRTSVSRLPEVGPAPSLPGMTIQAGATRIYINGKVHISINPGGAIKMDVDGAEPDPMPDRGEGDGGMKNSNIGVITGYILEVALMAAAICILLSVASCATAGAVQETVTLPINPDTGTSVTTTSTTTASMTPSSTTTATTTSKPSGKLTMSISPASQQVAAGAAFDVTVSLNAPNPVGGIQMALGFDATKVQASNWTEGSFLKTWAQANGESTIVSPQPTIKNSSGNITDIGIAIMGASTDGPTGTGDLVVFHMTTVPGATGTASFTLYDVAVVDPNGAAMPKPTVTNGQVTLQ